MGSEKEPTASSVQEKALFTRQETATYLNISLGTLAKLDIPKVKFMRYDRFRKTDIDNWVEQQTQGASL